MSFSFLPEHGAIVKSNYGTTGHTVKTVFLGLFFLASFLSLVILKDRVMTQGYKGASSAQWPDLVLKSTKFFPLPMSPVLSYVYQLCFLSPFDALLVWCNASLCWQDLGGM